MRGEREWSSVLRVMSYNILNGAAGHKAAMLEVVQHCAPDLLFLQEVASEESAQQFAGKIALPLHRVVGRTPQRKVALFTHFPLLASDAPRAFPMLRPLLCATVALPDGQRLNLFGVHLGVIHDWWRIGELFHVLRFIQQYQQANPAPFSLLAGDFNAVAPGERVTYGAMSLLHRVVVALQFAYAPRRALTLLHRAGYTDCFRACHPRADGFTFPTADPAIRLDYIFANPCLAARLCHCDVFTTPRAAHHASDHYPLLATFWMGEA